MPSDKFFYHNPQGVWHARAGVNLHEAVRTALLLVLLEEDTFTFIFEDVTLTVTSSSNLDSVCAQYRDAKEKRKGPSTGSEDK